MNSFKHTKNQWASLQDWNSKMKTELHTKAEWSSNRRDRRFNVMYKQEKTEKSNGRDLVSKWKLFPQRCSEERGKASWPAGAVPTEDVSTTKTTCSHIPTAEGWPFLSTPIKTEKVLVPFVFQYFCPRNLVKWLFWAYLGFLVRY